MKRDEKIALVKSVIGGTGKGLEIGPHVHPMVRKSEGYDVSYLETRSTEQLIQLLRSEGKDTANVEHIDYVLNRNQSLFENVGQSKFNWVLTSHVLEHIPNFVGHLNEVSSVLDVGGRYVAYIPDRNLCFDVQKPLSSLGDVLEAHVEARTSARFAALVDELRYAVRPEGVTVGGWGPEEGDRKRVAKYPEWRLQIKKMMRTGAAATKNWFGHSWRFDPISFAEIVESISELEIIDMELTKIIPTYNMDFLVVFEKVETIDLESVEEIRRSTSESYMCKRI